MAEARIKEYKNKGRDLADLKQRRSDMSVELRKQKKDDEMLKRHYIDATAIEESRKEDWKTSLSAIIAMACSKNNRERLQAVQSVRVILSMDKNPPIDDLIEVGVVPILAQCLDSDNSFLQFEAASALTDIASGNSQQTNTVMQSGAVPRLIQLLDSTHMYVAKQAVWALRYISGSGTTCRDYVIAQGIIPPLLKFVHIDTEVSFLRNVAWILSNLCRNKNPPPPFESVCQTLPALVFLVQHDDMQVKGDACWALSFLAEGNEKQIQVVVESDVIPKLVPLLDSKDNRVLLLALRTLGNILTGNDEQTQRVLDGGILPYLLNLMTHSRPGIVREAVWSVSNIIAGNKHQVQMVIEANLVPTLIKNLQCAEFKTQKKAALAVSNFTISGTQDQVSYLIQQGAIPAMCNLLDCRDVTTVHVLLDGLRNMLKLAGPRYEVLATMIEECGGLEKLEKLQQHKNEDIYKLSYFIIDKYFSRNDIEGSALSPEAAAQTYQFGPSQVPDGGFQL